MRGRRFRFALLTALAALVLCAGLGPARAAASDDSADTSDVTTITTVLHPGWNMVGWVGPETPAERLFEAIPALESVFAWDSEAQQYQWQTRTRTPDHGLRQLTPGHGLWLYLGGTEVVEWTRPVSDEVVLLELHAGRNLVGWTGGDGTPIEDALARLRDTLELVWHFDAAAQEYRLYHPKATANSLTELNRGDAILVDVSRDTRWWQSELVVFVSELGEDRQAQIREWAETARTVITERWAVRIPFIAYVGDPESVASAHFRHHGSSPPDLCGQYVGSRMYIDDGCFLETTFMHLYSGVVHNYLSTWWYAAPAWLVQGSHSYLTTVYRGWALEASTPEQSIEAHKRGAPSSIRMHERPPLADLEDYPTYYAQEVAAYSLSFMALDWLVERASEASIFEFLATLDDGSDWREAFELAFGITADDFYEQFEEYISKLAPPLAHLTDDRTGPVVVFADGTPTDVESTFRDEFATLMALFDERLEADAIEYTVYVAANRPSFRAQYEEVFGNEPRDITCMGSWPGHSFILEFGCEGALDRLNRVHFQSVRGQLAPSSSLPQVEGDVPPEGPHWLWIGTQAYVEYAFQAATGRGTLDGLRNRERSRAGVAGPLDRHLTHRDSGEDYLGSLARTFLAVDWLVQRAGEPAIFEYYRVLPDSESWQQAFEAAFGIAIDDFYEAFEEYRAEVAPRFPHLADTSDEPALAFEGDLPAETREAVRAEFDALRTFYEERFGAGTADYTVYLAADGEPLADVHQRVFNSEPPEGFCDGWTYRRVAVVALSCHSDPPYGLASYHFRAINLQVTFEFRWGPRWLSEGGQAYVEYAYQAGRGYAESDVIRSREVSRAMATASPLKTLDTDTAFDEVGHAEARALGFLAMEWLVERAGESAIFEYYRLRAGLKTWEAAFEAAFDLTVDDFYEAFEAYRARVAPPDDEASSP